MAITSKEQLKSYFETGDYPTEENFGDLIDTMLTREDIEGWNPGTSPGTVDTELSETSMNPLANATITAELKKKVSAEEGKGLSTNDFTDEDKEKLAGLKNYDDSGIKQDIEDLSKKVEDLEHGGQGGSTPDLSEYLTKEEFNETIERYVTTEQLTELSEGIALRNVGAEDTDESVDEPEIGGGGGSGDDTMTRIVAGATPYICYKKTDGTIGFWDGYFVGTNHRQQTDIVEILFGGLGATPNSSQFLNGWTNLEKIYPLMNGSGCTDLSFAFQNDAKLKDLSMLKEWDVSKVTTATYCFAGCAPEILPIESWDISNITNMSSMFQNYQGVAVDMSQWANNKVTSFASFMRRASFEKVDLHNVNTENCASFAGFAREALSLKWLDIRGWSCVAAQADSAMHAMFLSCRQLTTLVGDTSVEAVIADNIKVLDGYTATSNISIKESSIPLNRASLRALINGLADMTETGAILTIGSANIAKLTNDDIAVATAKGWTIS